MVSVIPNQLSIQAVVQRAVRSRQISRQEHLQLTSAMLSNPGMPSTDRSYINRVLDYIRAGKIRLTD